MADNDPKMRVTDPQPFIKLDEDQYDPDPFNTGDVDVPLPPGYGLDDDVTKALDEEMRREEVLDRALAKYDTSSLESKPGKSDNWIEGVGGELPSFVRAVAHALMRGGKPKSQAIGMAIGQMKNWASGQGNVTAKTRAKAAAAVAEWEALRAKAAAK